MVCDKIATIHSERVMCGCQRHYKCDRHVDPLARYLIYRLFCLINFAFVEHRAVCGF